MDHASLGGEVFGSQRRDWLRILLYYCVANRSLSFLPKVGLKKRVRSILSFLSTATLRLAMLHFFFLVLGLPDGYRLGLAILL